MKHSYYYNLVIRVLKFLIPEGNKVLYYGFYNEKTLPSLNPSYAVCIYDRDIPIDVFQKDPNYTYIHSKYYDYVPDEKFDYIVLDVALGQTEDICLLLKNVFKACLPHTRIIVHQENYIWQGILKISAMLGLKHEEKTKNWLSIGDINLNLKSAGFEVTRVFKKNIFPAKLGFIGPVLNLFSSLVPLFDFFKLDQFIVARPIINKTSENSDPKSLTICLTVRDEGANIEPIVKSLPILCNEQEILFVEGHSKDNTISEIERMQIAYPEKNIHLIHQPGKGQGDAIRVGFKEAEGDIVILYEGDGTSDPSDIQYFYNAIKNGYLEFIEGSRFAYPLMSESMPLLNKIGNMFFSKWFTWFLNQRTTDVLSGIKAIKKKDYELIYNSWGFIGMQDPFGDFELLYGSVRYGLKIGEIPIHYKPRTYGISKTKVFKHGIYLLKMAFRGYWIFRNSKYQIKT